MVLTNVFLALTGITIPVIGILMVKELAEMKSFMEEVWKKNQLTLDAVLSITKQVIKCPYCGAIIWKQESCPICGKKI